MAITFYATNNFTGDGTTVNWNINFADGYIDITTVKARYLDNTGSYVDIAISSVAGNVVTISPAVADGQEFQIYRDTEKRFPLVDFSDGAILNETNLDTLATQAVMVSAEAFDQSNNGVRIAGDSLVVAQGIDAKAQEALDNSEAAVATANGIDGKAQTALNTAAAAVATANAATSTAAGAVSTANTALSTAHDAADDAATAITTANGAVITANAATTTANAASAAASAATTTANSAANDAATAVSTAGTALSTANTASTNASTAVSTANGAKATAEGIEAKADSALAASATAVSTANSAEATANAIDGKATDALDTADSAVATANAAVSTANSATATANAASSTASSAASDASTALSTANAIDAKAQTALDNTTALDAATMKKAANLSDIADKAAAWLNVRPIGSTPLAGDPVGDYDAVTKRWVENLINTGTVGPTMNGVMNFGVGDFHLRDSRAYIQPYEVVSDGQLLNRADWPELWAYAQMLSPITDAAWLADPLKRGAYSTGNGTTTFRVPDRNGVQSGSVRALFGRGDGGNSSIGSTIMESFVPNITATLNMHGAGPASEPAAGTNVAGFGGALVATGEALPRYLRGVTLLSAGGNSYGGATFDASRSSAAYGRGGLTTDEVLPRNFTGVWVIRASGGFVAANTQWQVINQDATRPGNGTAVLGGNIVSEYRVGGALEGTANFRMAGTIDGSYGARIAVYNATSLNGASFDFTEHGNIETPLGRAIVIGNYGIGSQADAIPTSRDNAFISNADSNSSWSASNGGGFQITYAANRIVQFWVSQGGTTAYFRANSTDSNPQRPKSASPWVTLQNAGTSDANVKTVLGDLDLSIPLSNINALEFKKFRYNKDGEDGPVRRGIIAQQAQNVDPEYVHSADKSGVMTLDSNPLLLDALAAVKALSAKVAALEERIDELTSQ
ncbi:tail fiber protein [Escherichia phage PGT2]|uniref:Tail fiber protein n=1 Tax=Escherichia phage PGT2 TaxID=2047782 RepID=A0A2D2W2V1_9CAUD|nr:tail fiber protein [Escherichia phage PGT2]ATS92458.1 tail fiber protein [Escherichia phage PGT2]